ncbi:MAG: hypothetical protein ACR2NU_13360 [Aeoliella sp.]
MRVGIQQLGNRQGVFEGTERYQPTGSQPLGNVAIEIDLDHRSAVGAKEVVTACPLARRLR